MVFHNELYFTLPDLLYCTKYTVFTFREGDIRFVDIVSLCLFPL